MKTITVDAIMQNGSGFGVFVKIGAQSLYFDKSGSQQVQVAAGDHKAVVGGHEPTNSTVTITIKDGGKQLASQSYVTPTFFGYIPFTA